MELQAQGNFLYTDRL